MDLVHYSGINSVSSKADLPLHRLVGNIQMKIYIPNNNSV